MRKLVIKGSTPLKEFPISAGVTIGSLPGNTIHINNNKVDGEHAKVMAVGPHVFVEDLNSRGGLTVNGKKVTRCALKKNDIVEIGGVSLVYFEDDKPEPSAAPAAAPKPAGASVSKLPVVKPGAPVASSPASSGARQPVPRAGAASPGSPSPAAPLGSSSRNPAAGARNAGSSRKMVDEAMSSASQLALDALKKRSEDRAKPAPGGGGGTSPKAVVAGLVVSVLLIVGLVAFAFIGGGESAVPNDSEAQAVARLKTQKFKDPADLQLAQTRLLKAKSLKDIEAVLGTPAQTFKDKIPLYDPEAGTTDFWGNEFFAYYMKTADWADNDESPVSGVLLFRGQDDGKIEMLGYKTWSRKPLPPRAAPAEAVVDNAAAETPTPVEAAPVLTSNNPTGVKQPAGSKPEKSEEPPVVQGDVVVPPPALTADIVVVHPEDPNAADPQKAAEAMLRTPKPNDGMESNQEK